MMNETIILIENIDFPDEIVNYSAPIKGAGYHFQDGLHTFTYELEEFVGTLTLQGTLALFPGDDDWVNINNTEFVSDGSTDIVSNSFSGNFVWVRCKYQIDSGTIHRVRCNH